MSADNGHRRLPEGCIPATLAMLEEIWSEWVRLEGASAKAGQDIRVLVGPIGKADYVAMLPEQPPGAEAWPDADRERLTREWLDSLAPEDRRDRTKQYADMTYYVASAGLLEPRLTPDEARRLGDDAALVARAVLRLSGLLREDAASTEAAAPQA